MKGRLVRLGIGALVVALAIVFGVRACSEGEEGASGESVTPVVAPSPSTQPALRRAQRPVDTEPVADGATPAARAEPVVPPEFRQPKPVIVVVTCGAKPVESCSFAIERPSGAPRQVGSFSRQPDGAYRLGIEEDVDLPVTVIVKAPGWPDARVVAAARETPVEVRLPEGGRVTGVVQRPDGEPVGGAHVIFAGRVATADAAGRFAFDDVAIGRHERAQVSTVEFLRSVACDVEVTHPGDADDVTLVVDETVSLRVRVVRAADGVPLAKVTVRGEGSSDGEQNQAAAETGADGIAELRGLRDGTYRLAVFGDDIEAAFVRRTPVPRDDVIEIRAEPYVLRRASARVVDPSGRPVPGLSVALYVSHAADSHRTTTAKDGSFEFTGIRAYLWGDGKQVFTAVPLEQLVVSIYAKDGTDSLHVWLLPREDQTIVWAPKTMLSVTLRDASGTPLPDVSLDYRTPVGTSLSREKKMDGKAATSRIDWFGRFAAPGTLTIQLADGRKVVRDIAEMTGERTWLGTIDLDAVGRLSVVVSPPMAAGGVVFARRDDAGKLTSVGSCNASTHWTTRGIAVGRHRLVASAPGRVSVEIPDVEIRANDTTRLSVTLPHPADAAVFVRHGGRPVAGAVVEVEPLAPPPGAVEFRRSVHVGSATPDDDPALALAATTDTSGRVLFRRLPPGPARFSVRTTDGAERVVERNLADGARETVDVEVE